MVPQVVINSCGGQSRLAKSFCKIIYKMTKIPARCKNISCENILLKISWQLAAARGVSLGLQIQLVRCPSYSGAGGLFFQRL
jgi:hypothetical protein